MNVSFGKMLIGIPVILIICAIWLATPTARSITIDLGNTKVKLKYTGSWGLQMHQELQLARADGSGPTPSVDDVVFKRTYNADGPLYKDQTGTNYYFVFNNSIQIINPANMTFRSICELDGKQELQVLGSFKLVSLNPKDHHIGDSDSDWKVTFVAVDRVTTSKPVVPNRCG